MLLKRPPQKKLSPKRQKLFWQEYDAGRIKENEKRQFTRLKTRRPVFASPSIMGTIREFENRWGLLKHVQKVSRTNRLGSQTKFDSFEFQQTQILAVDTKNLRPLERVYMAPNFWQIIHLLPEQDFHSPFGKKFWQRMQKKGVKLEELRFALKKAIKEIKKKIFGKIPHDYVESNYLVLDFDPKTKKPLIAIIDHGGSNQKW